MTGDITRFPGAPGRSRAVVHSGLVFTVATAAVKSASLREQTEDALRVLDQRLAETGTDKTRLLSATVYITDMGRKPEMNEAWLAWVAPGSEPQRACIGAALEGQDPSRSSRLRRPARPRSSGRSLSAARPLRYPGCGRPETSAFLETSL